MTGIPFFSRLRRNRLRGRCLPSEWSAFIEKNVSLYRRLPSHDREELHGHVQVFLAEKHFEGAGGLVVTDEIRVTIAAQACMLLLHRPTGYFPGLSSIIVYPGECVAGYRTVDEIGVVTEWTDIISGESSERGTLVLSWEDVIMGCAEPHDGYNVVIHEFAHQLDAEDGITDGIPFRYGDRDRRELAEVFRREFDRLRDESGRGLKTLLDPYGAEDPAEFFAVASECFFERSRAMKARHPDLYGVLCGYFRQDPAEFAG